MTMRMMIRTTTTMGMMIRTTTTTTMFIYNTSDNDIDVVLPDKRGQSASVQRFVPVSVVSLSS
jgi:hypothetical protein